MFALQNGRGFTIEFNNGWTVSVKWGAGSYSSNHNKMTLNQMVDPKSNSAEAAAFKGSEWHIFETKTFDEGTEDEFTYKETVRGWLAPEEVLAFMNEIAKKEA